MFSKSYLFVSFFVIAFGSRISEEELETGTSSNDNSGFADVESCSEEDSASKSEESSSESDDIVLTFRRTSRKMKVRF